MQMTPVSHLHLCRCGCSPPCGSQTWWARAARVSTCSPPTSNLWSDVSAEDTASHFMDTLFRQRLWLCAGLRLFLGHDLCFYRLPGVQGCPAAALFLGIFFVPYQTFGLHIKVLILFGEKCLGFFLCTAANRGLIILFPLCFLGPLVTRRCSAERFRGLIAMVNYVIPKTLSRTSAQNSYKIFCAYIIPSHLLRT